MAGDREGVHFGGEFGAGEGRGRERWTLLRLGTCSHRERAENEHY